MVELNFLFLWAKHQPYLHLGDFSFFILFVAPVIKLLFQLISDNTFSFPLGLLCNCSLGLVWSTWRLLCTVCKCWWFSLYSQVGGWLILMSLENNSCKLFLHWHCGGVSAPFICSIVVYAAYSTGWFESVSILTPWSLDVLILHVLGFERFVSFCSRKLSF